MDDPRHWHTQWLATMGGPPARPSSREESIQEVLSHIFLGLSPAYFVKYVPTQGGAKLLSAIWDAAFPGGILQSVEWLVSEYALPVPEDWRREIRLTYRAPDFVCGADNRILIIELKTERGSYSDAQISDFLRLARRLHPDAEIDLILIEERRRHVRLELSPGQRYAELTWVGVAQLMRAELPDHPSVGRLSHFVSLSLPGGDALHPNDPTWQISAAVPDLVTTAVDQALHIAPALARDPANAKLERGIDVPFASERDARIAEVAVREALAGAGHHHISTWLWRKASGGTPATPAGQHTGIELRIYPRRLT